MMFSRQNIRTFFRQLRHLRLLLVFGLVFLLPFVAPVSYIYPKNPIGQLLGGLFVDLSFLQVLSGTLFVVLLGIALIINQALIIDGIYRRYHPSFPLFRATEIFSWTRLKLKRSSLMAAHDDQAVGVRRMSDYVPPWLDVAFGFPLGRSQLIILVILCLPWLVVVTLYANSPWLGALGILLGVAAALLLFGLTLLISCWGAKLWRFKLFQFKDRSGTLQLATPHIFALVSVAVTLFGYGLLGALAVPPVIWLAPIGFFLVMLIILTYVTGFFEFYLPAYGVPATLPLVVILIFGLIGSWFGFKENHYLLDFSTQDHDYEAVPVKNVIAPEQENLVVIAVSGGGILSATWSTYWLYQLLTARPKLACEIRLLSTVSGGTVGVANYLFALNRHFEESPSDICDPRSAQAAAKEAHGAARQSSLAYVTYGLAYPDLWRLLTVGIAAPENNRGQYLEEAWARHAGSAAQTEEDPCPRLPCLSDLAEPIARRQLPGFVFNTTVLETGRRVMITPLELNKIVNRERAQTLSELLVNKPRQIDLSLYTAARASATFPYVSPAARSDLPDIEDLRSSGYHLLDGGYNDNYGIQSLLDVLRPTLITAEEQGLKRILIIEMRLTNFESEAVAPKPTKAFAAEWFGPPAGFFNASFKAQIEKNNIDLDAFQKMAESVNVDVEILTLQPSETVPGPLSWHFATEDIETLFPSKAGALVAYKAGTMPVPHGASGYRCSTDAGDSDSCALKLVFDSWKKPLASGAAKDAGKNEIQTFEYIDCLAEMDVFLAEGDDFDPACKARLVRVVDANAVKQGD